MLALAYAKAEHGHETDIWRLVAFLGRYAHQPVNVLLSLTMPELNMLAKATARLLTEEAKAGQTPTED